MELWPYTTRKTIRWRGKRMVVTKRLYGYGFVVPPQRYAYFSQLSDRLLWTSA